MNSEKFLRDIFLSEDLSDIRVIVEHQMIKCNFPVHSFVLKRYSPVFRKMLESDFAENQSKTITITDFKASHVKQFFRYLYTDALPEGYNSLRELMKLAHKYMVRTLMEKCEEALLEFLNFRNIYEFWDLADLYSLEKLRGDCLTLVKRAAFKLLKFEELECFSEEIMTDIVSADDLNISNELEVFWAIWKWGNLKASYENKEISNEIIIEIIKDLLKHVRWSSMNEEEKNTIESLGITVDDSDLQEGHPRVPISIDSPRFLNQCSVLNFEDISSSNTFLETAYDILHSSQNRNFLRLMSLADAPFYVVGVVFACAWGDMFGKLVCSCESASSEAILQSKYSERVESRRCEEVMCEFLKPVTVCKNQTLTIMFVCAPHEYNDRFGSWKLNFDRNVIRGDKGRTLCMEGDVIGIRKLFLL